MYGKSTNAGTLQINQSKEGESIERRVEKLMAGKEPIHDTVDAIYTERGDGVQPQYNIRTDRFEMAIEATDKMVKMHRAKRENAGKLREPEKGNAKGESTDGKSKDTPKTE